jgi:hypothetical protein
MLRPIHNVIVDGHALAIVLDDSRGQQFWRSAEIKHFGDQSCIPIESGIGQHIPEFCREPVETVELPLEPAQTDLRRAPDKNRSRFLPVGGNSLGLSPERSWELRFGFRLEPFLVPPDQREARNDGDCGDRQCRNSDRSGKTMDLAAEQIGAPAVACRP